MNSKVSEAYALLKTNNISEALKIAKSLFDNSASNQDVYSLKLLATCHYLSENRTDALKYFNMALKIAPNDFEIINNLSLLSFERDDFESAYSYALRAIQINPNKSSSYIILANIFSSIKDFTSANTNILKAIELSGGNLTHLVSENIDIIILYLDILLALDDQQAAKNIVINIKEKYKTLPPSLFHYLANNLPSELNENDIEKIKKCIDPLEKDKTNINSIMLLSQIYFALGKIELKINSKLSDDYFLKGNALISGVLRFKPLDHQKRCIKLIENFFEIKNFKIANPLKGKGLIFITGLPRSGTTLMESIISSNELTFAGGELHTLVNLTTDTIDQMKSFNLDFIETIGDQYLKNVQFMNKTKKFFVDKMPLNYELIGLISVALPGAKIINMQRNFWDVAISQFQQYYVKNVPYSSNFFNIALVAANFEELIKIYSKEISPSTLLNLKYEDLVSEPNYWASRVYEFCEITSPYSPIQRSKHVTKSASQTQVKAEIHTQSLEKANFIDFHEDFLKNIDMQRSFWKLKRSSLN